VKRLKRHVVRLRVRLAGLGVAARFASGALGAVILGGTVWLIWAMISPEPMIAVARELDAGARDRAAAALTREGISFRRTQRGLAVSQRHLADARKVLRSGVLAGESSRLGLRELANSSSIWQTDKEKQYLRLLRLMIKLERMLTEMDPIESALVQFEPGSPGGFGSEASAASAAVQVTLAKGRRMSPRLTVAIGELISGSVKVDIAEVRVIDQTGRSHRPTIDVQALAQRHAVEAYYSEKIVLSLRHISGISADVQIIGFRGGLHRIPGDGLRVCLSVPRSYVMSAGNAESAALQMASIKDAVQAILGPVGRHEVNVAVHESPVAVTSSVRETDIAASQSMFIIAMIASAVVGGMGLWLVLRCRGLVELGRQSADTPAGEESGDELSYNVLTPFVDDESSDDRSENLAREHPQTLALIMARMPAAQAADIISGLPVDLRAEVARRMGDLSDADAEVVSEINRDLTRRMSGRATGVSGQSGEPDSIGRRHAERDALTLMAFEDIMLLGQGELRVALGAVDPDDLAISLRMAAKHTRRKVLGSLSPKDAEYVRARMDRIGPMRICDVESARHRVMETVSQVAGVPHAPVDAMEEAV
jgi:hypothetical protein